MLDAAMRFCYPDRRADRGRSLPPSSESAPFRSVFPGGRHPLPSTSAHTRRVPQNPQAVQLPPPRFRAEVPGAGARMADCVSPSSLFLSVRITHRGR